MLLYDERKGTERPMRRNSASSTLRYFVVWYGPRIAGFGSNNTDALRKTRNPDKYTKNAERNRLRAIETERRHIWSEALRQAQRLAAVHDPTGATFGIGAVTTNEDGTVVSVEAQRRREERRKAVEANKGEGATSIFDGAKLTEANNNKISEPSEEKNEHAVVSHRIHGPPVYTSPNSVPQPPDQLKNTISRSQQKRLTKFEPRPPPPRPILPEGVSVPEGEENWIALWDLPDDQLERRVLRAKKRAAAARKALRVKQKSGKVERRAARDEKRKVYRELKLTWKMIKGRFRELQLCQPLLIRYHRRGEKTQDENKECRGRRGQEDSSSYC